MGTPPALSDPAAPENRSMHDDRHRTAAQGALELMTAWADRPDGPPDLFLEVMERRIEEHPSGDRLVAAVELVMGMTRLCGSVLNLREMEEGIPVKRTLQDIALHLAEIETS